MIILKLVAWSDRPENRENDLADILKIIQHYFQIAFDEIAAHHNDTFPEDTDIDHMLIAARVLGREAGLILNKSDRLSDYVMQTLHANLDGAKKSSIAKKWAQEKDWTVEYAHSILQNFHMGIVEK